MLSIELGNIWKANQEFPNTRRVIKTFSYIEEGYLLLYWVFTHYSLPIKYIVLNEKLSKIVSSEVRCTTTPAPKVSNFHIWQCSLQHTTHLQSNRNPTSSIQELGYCIANLEVYNEKCRESEQCVWFKFTKVSITWSLLNFKLPECCT